ncbi:MAG: hypothetical protein GHCLOJNM_03769 [bacterium]|nr:hypothetical protein [bacterium]
MRALGCILIGFVLFLALPLGYWGVRLVAYQDLSAPTAMLEGGTPQGASRTIRLAMTPTLLLLGSTFLIGLFLLIRGDKRADRGGEEESRILQEVHQGLSGLERRVESLETLLMYNTRNLSGEESRPDSAN